MAEDITTDCNKSYGQILKTTAVFGSVKIFSVLIGLFKAKIIAIFLGPAGMGVFNLINYPVTLFSQFSGLGISTSGIREVAQTQDEQQLSETAEVIKYWNRTLGIIGSLILFALAPWVSKLSFGHDSYTWAFQILSVVVFLTNLGSEYEVLLRGRRETKLVAKAGFYSSLAGFIASIPFYYAFGTTGIVVVILITSITLAGVNYMYARKLNIRTYKIPYWTIFQKGKNMASIGFFIVMGDLIYVTIITFVNVYIRGIGGIDDVGFFQACLQITQSSINVILLAMAADYYPRLSSVQGNEKVTSKLASEQAEIASLICCPLLVCLIVIAPLVIRILLSNDFVHIQTSIRFFLIGTMFRLPVWAMTFVLLANGKTKLYVFTVILSNILIYPLYCLGYKMGGISGIGISYIVLMLLFIIIQNAIIKVQLNIYYSSSFWKIYLTSCIITLLSLPVIVINNRWLYALYGLIVIIFAVTFSVLVLNKRIGIVNIIKQKIVK